MNLFLLIIISHLISDFLLQFDKLVQIKQKNKLKGFLSHGFIVFIITLFLTFIFGIKIAFLIAFIISIIHIVLDIIKENIMKIFKKLKIRNKKLLSKVKFYTFIVDQFLHFLIIFVIWDIFNKRFAIPVDTSMNYINSFGIDFRKILILIIFYLIVLFVGAAFLEKLLNIIDIQIDNQSNDINMGKYIGIIERALILTLVTFGSLSSIGIIFTAKSIARFNKLEEKHFVEYYLLGTLTSIFIALIGGLILKNIILF
ncbi:MAG: DUF3307 domain-containing protein [Nanoarchaeota archaeon]